jgi:hypothetical protein
MTPGRPAGITGRKRRAGPQARPVGFSLAGYQRSLPPPYPPP